MTLPFALGTLRVAAPLWLFALLALPLFFAAAPDGRRRWAVALCRAGAAAAIALVLAGVSLERSRPEAGTCIVAAIDASASVQHAGASGATAFFERLDAALGPHDLVGSVVFAARPHVVAHPAAGRREPAALVPAPASDLTGFETGDTDLAAALVAAAPLCPEGKQAVIVLFTDGNETRGSLLAEAARVEPPIPISAVVPPATELPLATIRRLLAPPLAPERTILPLAAVIENRAAAPLKTALRLAANGSTLTVEEIELTPGFNVIALPYRLRGAGQYLLEADLLAPPEAPLTPGIARSAVAVTRPLHALVLSERETPVVATALAERGMHVEVVAPGGLGPRLAHLREYHVVILDDVARAGLTDDALASIAAYVAGGGALVAAGGEHLFGDPGFVGTPLERVLPVELQSQEPEPQEREPIALYLVIDRSNSMGYSSSQTMVRDGEKMEYAKRAALAVLDQLAPRDLASAIVFDSEATELGPLAPVGESRAALGARIQQIQYGGGTDFKDALEIARRNLVESGRRVRHVILLTDGDSNRAAEDHASVIASLARAEITVTTIRIGNDTINLDLLDAISRATGGEFHHVANPRALPQLMIRDTQRLTDAVAERRAAAPRIGEGGAVLAGIREDELPVVEKWAITRAKKGAELRLYVEAGERRDPILATWQYELGRTAVIPVDFQSGAATWAGWEGFAKLWAQLALWAAPAGLASDVRLEAERLREGTLVRLETGRDDAGPFALRLTDALSGDRERGDGTGRGGEPGHGDETGDDAETDSGAETRRGAETAYVDIPLHRSGRRTFSAVVSQLKPGVHPVRLLMGDGLTANEQHIDLVVPTSAASGRELRATAPNTALLRQVADLTGGTISPDPAALVTARPGVKRHLTPLAVVLIPLALALLLVDIALRRLVR